MPALEEFLLYHFSWGAPPLLTQLPRALRGSPGSRRDGGGAGGTRARRRDGHRGAREPPSPGAPPSPPSPPPQQSPPPPAAPESPGASPAERPSEAHARQVLLQEWGPPGGSLELPRASPGRCSSCGGRSTATCCARPTPKRGPGGRVRQGQPSRPEGVYHLPISGINIYEPAPPTGPTRQPLETLGNFRGWYIRTEQLEHNCRFEDSQLDVCVYELHVWLLAADRHTAIAQHHVAPRTSGRGPPGRWVQVSHVFRQYGPGVRFVHFLHKTKNRVEPGGLRRTRVTDSSVSVQFRE
ncbi:hypothetical protein QTO34_010411 [Cnephaeus nilssonii]|uniref:FBA domain-containing protein n=1 Tax=Cnephaeus nilssonii TaxID=3371016 RepID=A0AA40LFT0_CNENI|nr:hypothetical protein QTO34_010411 [Eptesicus nilssonii]